ncbi:MAG: bifunctional methylenetetrahydrofolate dehydrogenase/methenyltetrahydrofolate cyclohydrolase FolD [Chlamydiae bacterium]|nr:bifunctional methylenetetrahydrofolate dehydrogenase/methenyltetrahydrofolate cyclohydrolase FolD [Chlamydiota bacterium]
MTQLIDGKKIAFEVARKIAATIEKMPGRKPGLAVLLVGENPSSKIYIAMKKKKCEELGILSFDEHLPFTITEQKLIEKIEEFNEDPSIDGILVQMPLPPHIDPHRIIQAIDPSKDVDGFHPMNMGNLLLGNPHCFCPCTPLGIHSLLIHSNIPISGKHVVIVGRSSIVGKPLAALLMQKAPDCNATVTIAHSMSENLQNICKSADILIAAVGQAHFIKENMIQEGACVIDVGINRVETSSGRQQILGDVDFAHVAPKCSSITPVPGGVGPMTIAMLMSNTLLSFERKPIK